MPIGGIPIGGGAPLVLISGLNVLEDEAAALACARRLGEIARRRALPLIFKASFDKANRTRGDAFRGPGIDDGLRVLAPLKREPRLPLLTDAREPHQPKRAAAVVRVRHGRRRRCLPTAVPAGGAPLGRPVNLKKGQFVAPAEMRWAVEKLAGFGCEDTMVTERGTCFGYRDLVMDPRSLVEMRSFAPVCFDATHSVQRPGAREGASGGERRFIAPLARAAAAVGIDALFVEVHAEPERAPVDGPSQIEPAALDELLGDVIAIDRALRAAG